MANARLLIVDDEGILARDLQTRLTNLGYDVPGIAETGEEAIAKAIELKPDLVLMDIVLRGDIDGIDTAEQLRIRFDIPSLFVTAYAGDTLIDRAKRAEPAGFLLKPINDRELRGAVEVALYRLDIQRRLRETTTELQQTLEAVDRERQEKLSLLESTGHGIYGIDMDGNCTFINRAAAEILGYAPDDAIGQNMHHLIHNRRADGSPYPVDECPLSHAVFTGAGVQAEDEFLWRRDGTGFPVHYTAYPIRTAGEVTGTVVTFADISERLRLDEALRASEQGLAEAEKLAHLGHWVWEVSADRLIWSDELYRIFGLEPQSVNVSLAEGIAYVHPDDRASITALMKRAVRDGEPYVMDMRVVRPDGETITIESRGAPQLDENGVVVRVRGTAQDITTRKQMGQARAHLAAIVQSSDLAIIGKTLDGIITTWNGGAERLYGYTAAEVVGQPMALLAPTDLTSEVTAILDRIGHGERVQQYETMGIRKDGTQVDVSTSIFPIRDETGGITGAASITRDITSRLREEETQRTLTALVAHSSDLIGYSSLDGQVRFFNPAGRRLHGIPTDFDLDAEPIQVERLFSQDSLAQMETVLPSLLRGESWTGEINLVHLPTGQFVPCEATAFMIPAPQSGEPMYLAAAARDLSARNRAADALKQSEERFRLLVDNIREVLWMTDLTKGEIAYISPGYEAIWGRTCESLYAQPREWIDAIHPDDRERVLQAALRQAKGTYDESYRIVRPDGTIRWIRDVAFPVRDESGTVTLIVGVAEDITERRQLEEQFRQAQKMEAIGVLAGGVAHDFNNLLTAIIGFTEIVLDRLSSDDASRPMLQEVVGAADRAAALTKQLLLFSRQDVQQLQILDLNEVVTNLEKLLRRIIGEDVDLASSLEADLGRVEADRGQIEQIIMNLVVNARDAMPKGGRLTISTANVEREGAPDEDPPDLLPREYVMLEVSDTGVGIDPATQARIFEPFFTTKDKGKGTGLGLATAYGIVKQSHGDIEVYSEPAIGTTFKIYLPRVRQLGAEDGHSAERPPEVRGSETILLVEDDEAVGRLAKSVLESHGYNVLEARNGRKALAVFHEHPEPIHLVLTDVIMPGMNGRELAEQLVSLQPALRILYMSGYTPDVAVRHGVLEATMAYLSKPFTPQSLARKVREALDA